MKIFSCKKLSVVCAVCLTLCIGGLTIYAGDAPRKQTSVKTRTKSANSNKGTKTRKKSRETSASVKKKEQNVKEEIRLTQKQIEENEAEVKKNRAILATLERDIAGQQRKVSDLQGQQQLIDRDIAGCKERIRQGEAKLAALRAKYVSVIKKMRIARKQANPLAYIFSSETFYQAWRRLRYFKKFNTWRAQREQEIKQEMSRLVRLNEELAAGHKRLNNNLSQQQQAQQALALKYAEQDEAVKKLQGHGAALRQHLARKQAEANALSSRVMALIAEEQEQARIAEQRRREAEAKAAAERAAREKAAEEQAAAEKAKAERLAQQQEKQKKQTKKDKAKDKKSGKKVKKPEPQQDVQQETKRSANKDYAEARGRRRRRKSETHSSGQSASENKVSPAVTASAGFASAKGSLPRPVKGNFKIVSRFGRHPLPDLPKVMFDNPGIDAVVDDGASALAVYPGTVTGVYVLPGFATVVIVSHGDYYTVYGNIGQPAVTKGEQVKQGQSLGKLLSDSEEDGRTTIHFEIYKNREKLNPEVWLQ